jgi:hypothetical protein
MAAIWLPFLVATPDGVVAGCCGPDARRFTVTGTERDFVHYPAYRFHYETQVSPTARPNGEIHAERTLSPD